MSVESNFAFAFFTLRDWLTKLVPLSQPMRSQTNRCRRLHEFATSSDWFINSTCSHAFSRAWRRLHVFATSSDWFNALFSFVLIDQSNYFGFGFAALI